MSHLIHLKTHKRHLENRFAIIRTIREFFWTEKFVEVETPNILAFPGQEPYLTPVKVTVRNERGVAFEGYLHTSPEYTMKKMLAAGFGDIYSISKVYRNEESFGGAHNPEFTMLEWYRVGKGMEALMDDMERLFLSMKKTYSSDQLPFFRTISDEAVFERHSMKDIWKTYVGVNLDEYLTDDAMKKLCAKKGYRPGESERYEDLFYRIFLNEIEPKLIDPTIIYHYPAEMAALARLSSADPRYAERFEVYVGGLELANAFAELTDRDEQYRRLEDERTLRKQLGKDVYDIDSEFVGAVGAMPDSAGIALGIDRLVQVLSGAEDIDDVLPLPMSQLFGTKNSPE